MPLHVSARRSPSLSRSDGMIKWMIWFEMLEIVEGAKHLVNFITTLPNYALLAPSRKSAPYYPYGEV